jgi:hypothetical protein
MGIYLIEIATIPMINKIIQYFHSTSLLPKTMHVRQGFLGSFS